MTTSLVWVQSVNGTYDDAFSLPFQATGIVDALKKAIRAEAADRGLHIVVAKVGGGGNASVQVQSLFHPDGNSAENPILFTEIIDPPTSAPSAGKQHIVLYYP